jgi:phosphoribosylanthranilate isomerase
VLLVARIVDDRTLKELVQVANELEVFCLIEAFDGVDLEKISRLGGLEQHLVGVNCRDLETLRVDVGRLGRLAPKLPSCLGRVAESGLHTPVDARRVAALGYGAALVGTALMAERVPGPTLAGLIGGLERPIRVKVCGLSRARDVDAAVTAGADAVGFVLAPSRRQITLDQATELAARLPQHVLPVAVFRNARCALADAARSRGFIVQGEGGDLPVLIDGADLVSRAVALGALRRVVLVDGPDPGSGRTADLSRVAAAARHLSVVLAGGLNAENVAARVAELRPAGVDVSSGVERAGSKCPHLIHAFVRAARVALESV